MLAKQTCCTPSPLLQPVYAACKRLFSSLPLAARIAEATLVLHGGLFRRQPQRGGGQGKNKRKRALPLLHGELRCPSLLGTYMGSLCAHQSQGLRCFGCGKLASGTIKLTVPPRSHARLQAWRT